MLLPQEFIAYKGDQFTVEWYYSPNGESQAFNYYRALAAGDRIKLLKLFKIIGDTGKIRDEAKFRNEGNKLFAFKSSRRDC